MASSHQSSDPVPELGVPDDRVTEERASLRLSTADTYIDDTSGLAYGSPSLHLGPHTPNFQRDVYPYSGGYDRLNVRLRPRIVNALATLWTPASKTNPPSFGQRDIHIAVMGMTGAGKTTFIRDIAGIEMEVGHKLGSCTKHIQVATTRISGHTVHIIDTPGFDDTDLKDSDILMTIANYLRDSASKDIRLSGILYLHRIIDPRVGGSALKNLKMFKKLVGDDNMGNVILLTTMWGKVNPRDGEERLGELVSTGKFWGGMIAGGAKYDRYGDNLEDAHRIVGSMLQNSPVVLQIQAELASGAKLENTEAGREVNERLEQLQAQHEKQLKEVREELLEASRVRNEDLARELQALNDKLTQEQKEAAEARERLHQAELQELQQRLKTLENRGRCIVC